MTIPTELLPPPRLSWQQVLASLPPKKRDAIMEALRDSEISQLVGDWFLSARREQIEPEGLHFIWAIIAGRGFGKNYAGSNWLIDEHRLYGAKNSGIVAATSSDLRRYCLEGPSGILSQAPNNFRPRYLPSKSKVVWPNGTITELYTSEKADRLRGPNLDRAWCDEVSVWQKPEDVLDMLWLCLRYGENPKAMMTMTPRPIPAVINLLKREGKDTVITRGSTMDNQMNLAPSFIKNILERFKGTSMERQEIYGEVLTEFEGALWSHAQIDECRISVDPTYIRKVIGVDPAITAKTETGIVAAGLTDEKKGVILGDHSIMGSPEQWGRKVIGAYYSHEANLIVAEKNQGGEMVKAVMHNIDSTVPIKLVHAAVGKVARAEPIAALYEQDKVSHLGNFPKLEDEMCLMVPGELKESPNRLDAMVWALTDLMLKHGRGRAGAWGRKKRNAA